MDEERIVPRARSGEVSKLSYMKIKEGEVLKLGHNMRRGEVLKVSQPNFRTFIIEHRWCENISISVA